MSYVPVLPVELDAPVHGAVDLLIIAGEHSGDEHAAVLVKNLLQDRPELKIAAVGGQKLNDAGSQLLFDLTHLSVVGFVEVLKHYKYFKRLFCAVLDWIKKNKPGAVLFIDYPGFNLRLAKALNESGIARKSGGDVQLLYYISPQVWAWKEKRKYEMAELIDSLSVIFPFEVDCFADTDLETTFVGHPFLQSKQDCELVYEADANVLLLAGSRVANVKLILPIFLKSYELFLNKFEQRDATVVYPSDTIMAEIKQAVSQFPAIKDRIRFVPNEGRIAASAVLTSSGTMSLRCGLAGIPGRIVHRVQFFTYLLGRYFLKVPYIGIANLLLEKPFYPEFIQDKAKPAVLAEELNHCLSNDEVLKITSEDCEELKRRLSQENEETPWSWLSKKML